MRTLVPCDDDEPRVGRLRGHGALFLVRVDLDHLSIETRSRQLGHGVLDALADDARDRDLRLARGDVDADERLLVHLRALGGLLREHGSLGDVRVGNAANLRHEPALLDQVLGVRLRDAEDVRHRDLIAARDLVADPAACEPRADEHGEHEPEADEPGPERAAALGRLVLRRPPADHLRRRGRVEDALAGEHHRRRFCGLGGDPAAARDGLEVGVHRGRGLVAVGRLLREGPDDDEVEVGRDVWAKLRRRRRDLGEVLHRDLDRALAGERDLAGEELEEHDPGRIEVRRLVDRGAARLLGREVLRGADDRALLGHLAGSGSRDPEVRHLHDSLGVDDDVVRLDVAVDDAVAVRVAERREDLPRIRDRDGHRAQAARADELLERPALDVLHDDEVGAVELAAVEDRDDIRVREPRGMRRLAPEALDELLVVRVPRVQHLDRDSAAELLVLGEVDVGHAAAAELARDAVTPREERSGECVLGRHGCRGLAG